MKKQVLVLCMVLILAGGMNLSAQVGWTKYENNPVLETGESGSWDSHGAVIISVLHEEGMYKAWYFGFDETEKDQLGYATSPDGITWTKDGEYPVFPLGEGGSWDGDGIDHACILKVDGVYKMWYMGEGDDHYRIGYASSADGRAWEKYAENPVLNLGAAGSWDGEELLHPCVVYDGETYHMWYNGYGQDQQRTGYATSADGIQWQKYEGSPVLSLGADGEWDDYQLGPMGVVYHDNTFHMWYSAGHGTSDENMVFRIGYAFSTDGMHWEKSGYNPMMDVGGQGAWDSAGVVTSSIIYDPQQDIFKMWYGGLTEKFMTGYATIRADSQVDVVEDDSSLPGSFTLAPNFPNPFNSQTLLQFTVAEESLVGLTVYNVLGQQVRTLVDGVRSPGTYHAIWDGRDDTGRPLTSGLYLYRLTAGGMVQTRKLMYLK